MFHQLIDWLYTNYIEVLGTIAGFIYIFFSIRQSIFLWPWGIISSVFSIYVFYNSRFYADMSLQVYYLVISFYGWYYWIFGAKKKNTGELPVGTTTKKLAINLIWITIVTFLVIGFLLRNYTNASLPWCDAFTFATSITATWMLTRKLIEQWWVWVFTDLIYVGMYINKALYAYTVLYFVYSILAIIGYLEWRKKLVA